MRVFIPILLAACSSSVDAPMADADHGKLIYGTDDRLDAYQVTDSATLALVDATAALMSTGDLSLTGGGYRIDVNSSLRNNRGVCSSEPYADQPTTAFCSGFLVGPDLLVTAGHCIDSRDCGSTSFVFDYHMTSSTQVRDTVGTDDVYFCDSIVDRENGTDDYAVVRLDRPVTGRTPMGINPGAPTIGAPLVMLGHPSGLPLKVAPGAQVRSVPNSGILYADVDAYGGNSGSPVVNANTGLIEGILVAGNPDYTWTGSCYVSNVCPSSGCPTWETVTRASVFESIVASNGGGTTPVPPSCIDDGYEPNDTQNTATPLPSGSYSSNQVCSTDDDWYVVSVPAGGTLEVDLTFTHAQGDLDLALWWGGTQLDLSQSTGNSEFVSADATADIDILVQVYGYQGAEAPYDLDINVIPPANVDMSLTIDGPAVAGQQATWSVSDGPPASTLYLVLGIPGSTDVPGCPGLSVNITDVVVAATMTTGGLGNASRTLRVPTGVTGQARTFYAVSLDTCEISQPLGLTFQ